MNFFWIALVVILLIVFIAVTFAKTRWERTPLEQAERARPLEKRRVSGEDD